ncbi:hypothetical protein HPP92_017906 [Vanilla planifolia]|uniref:J domain-containing protein n=1 Tax=Vanilla planifolia TaxID=51239 RepID=A0A835UP11_VANPL|nr:hypothetical protein HPP92_018484 [Vanilla planifolia]KAG0468578.1 hypothetical protein HPP92_017906 [Vanilla planifolia]
MAVAAWASPFFPPAAGKPLSFSWIHLGPWYGARPDGGGAGPASATSTAVRGCRDQDHYAVLGIRRTATAADVKRAYRMLARKYHPDVSRDLHAGEIFKRIRLAYEVLFDEVKRARYDLTELKDVVNPPPNHRVIHPNYKRRTRSSEQFREEWHNKRHKGKQASWSYHSEAYQDRELHERAPFSEVLRFAFFVLFFMQIVGCRASLAICGLSTLFDKQLDAVYKMGYVMAWLLGGYLGVLLTLCIYFTSWICGKTSSGAVVLVVVAMWVGANISRFAPLPQGAVLTLLYLSMKLHGYSK